MAEFGVLDLDEINGEADRLQDGGGENFLDQFVPMPDVKPGSIGTVTVRILPPAKGAKLYQYNRVHTLNDKKIHCPRPLENGKWNWRVPCPICDAKSAVWKKIDRLKKDGADDKDPRVMELKREADQLKAAERYYYNAIVRSLVIDGKEVLNVGPRILSIGVKLHTFILTAIRGIEGDPNSKLGNITDVKAGYDLVIRKKVDKGDQFPSYDTSGFARQPSPLGTPEEVAKWQESLHDLTKLRNPKDVEFLEKQLAIHRKLIDDDTVAFSEEKFDAKWKTKTGTVVVPAGVPTQNVEHVPASTATPAEVTAPPKPETLTIEDDEFIKELEEIEGKA